MAIPSNLTEDGIKHVDRHKSDASFDQAARKKTRLAKPVPAIPVANAIRFLIQLEMPHGPCR